MGQFGEKMRKKSYRFAITGMLIGMSILISACATNPALIKDKIGLIAAGDTKPQVRNRFGDSLPDLEHEFDSKGKKYRAEHYRLVTGSQQTGTVVCAPTCFYVPITVPVFSPYVVIYSSPDDKVLASGILETLSKSEDGVADIMIDLKISQAKAIEAQKVKK
jgi:hypothetical protein